MKIALYGEHRTLEEWAAGLSKMISDKLGKEVFISPDKLASSMEYFRDNHGMPWHEALHHSFQSQLDQAKIRLQEKCSAKLRTKKK
jgi:hypothetical protein